MKNYTFRIALFLFFGLALLAACSPTAPAVPGSASKPVVIINSPPSGSFFREGDQVTVQSTATDSTGVVRVELLVDGATARLDSTPNPQGQTAFSVSQTWTATAGSHTLVVRAINASGVMSDLAGIGISVSPRSSSAPTAEANIPTLTPQRPTLPPLAPTSTPLPVAPTMAQATACPQPQIASFGINPGEIKRGDNATLNWGAVTNATSAVIDNGIGGVPAPGSRSVRPDKKTTYVLTATGCGGTVTSQTTIDVFGLGSGQPGIPQGVRDFEKTVSFDWSNRSEFNSDNLSGIDIEINRNGSYQPFESATNLDSGNYRNKKAFDPPRQKIRFRWWQIDPKTKQRISLKSQWSVICLGFNQNEQCR